MMLGLTAFKANLPTKPYVSSDLSRLTIRTREEAVNYPYIQPNHPLNMVWLVFDVDRGEQSFYSYEDANLPPPNIVCQNWENANCHLFYQLETPVWMQSNASSKAQAYLKSIRIAITERIQADPCYSGLICKNPLHDRWRTFETNDQLFDLDYLAQFVDLKWQKSKEEQQISETFGRNCTLFGTLRLHSYEKISNYKQLSAQLGNRTYDMWLKDVEEQALAINSTFHESLPYSELRATAKSVAKWTWNNYQRGEDKQRGKMGFGETRHTNPEAPMLSDEERKERQRKSAELTNKHRKENTELKIKQAIERLELNGEKITKSAVSKMTGLHRKGIERNYSHLFPEKVDTTVAIR
jgi:Replicase family/Primase C terminal 1 (PriCT-1)